MRGLRGVTVIDLTQGVSGPFSTRLLAQMGARVIKIERPGTGELIREWDTHVNGLSSGHAWVNPGKESVSLNLRSDEGQEILLRLVAQGDVVIENYVPGTLERWGIGPDRLRAVNSNLIMCRISGFGQQGALADHPALDLIVQGEAGLIMTNGSQEAPAKISLSVADLSGAMYATISILLSLLEQRSGSGDPVDIDVPLFDSILSWTGYFPYMYWYQGREPGRVGVNHHTMFPYGPYEAADGKSLIIAAGAGSWEQWSRFCRTLGCEHLLDEQRYASNEARLAHRDELQVTLVEAFKQADRATWLERFLEAGIPSGAMNTFGEAMEHPRIRERGFVKEVASAAGSTKTFDFPPIVSGLEPVNELGPPVVGEHTAAVLAELGYSQNEVDNFHTKGIV